MKRIVLSIVVVLLGITLSGCMSHIEDTNGDDTSLETIDLAADIADGSFSSTSSMSSSISSGGSTFCFSHDDIDHDNMSISYGKISGVTRIHCADMDQGEELTLTITSTVTSGNLEIVVVDPDDNIVEEVAVNQTVTVTIPSTDEGEYFIIIGAESAEIDIDINRTIN